MEDVDNFKIIDNHDFCFFFRVNSVLDDMIPNAQHMPVISEEEEFSDQAELKIDQLRCDQDEHFCV